MNNSPLLSICIPTYNRAQYLKNTLESIVSQKEFNSSNVEIVISDNASTDNTEKIVKEFIGKYENIFYYKNEINILDRNFPFVLSKAHGELRKLCNDTLLFLPDSLEKILEIIKVNKDKKPVLFFINTKKNTDVQTKDLEKFLYKTSFYITWIGAFSVWSKDCINIAENITGCSEHLWQIPFILDYVKNKKEALIIRKELFKTQSIEKKDISYGLYTVFYENNLNFIKPYVEKNILSKKLFSFLEKDLLFNFFIPWIINSELQQTQYKYSAKENLQTVVFNTYKKKTYYIKAQLIYRLKLLKAKLENLYINYKTEKKGKNHE